jgi:hypothetical protein
MIRIYILKGRLQWYVPFVQLKQTNALEAQPQKESPQTYPIVQEHHQIIAKTKPVRVLQAANHLLNPRLRHRCLTIPRLRGPYLSPTDVGTLRINDNLRSGPHPTRHILWLELGEVQRLQELPVIPQKGNGLGLETRLDRLTLQCFRCGVGDV